MNGSLKIGGEMRFWEGALWASAKLPSKPIAPSRPVEKEHLRKYIRKLDDMQEKLDAVTDIVDDALSELSRDEEI